MTQHEELRAAACALVRAKWHTGAGHYAREVRQGNEPALGGSPSIAWVGAGSDAEGHAVARYIAAASPDAVLSLLDELETLRNLQQSMLQLEWQRGYDEGISDGMDK